MPKPDQSPWCGPTLPQHMVPQQASTFAGVFWELSLLRSNSPRLVWSGRESGILMLYYRLASGSWNMAFFSLGFFICELAKSNIFLSNLSCLWLTEFDVISLLKKLYIFYVIRKTKNIGKHWIYSICSLISHRHPNMGHKIVLPKASSSTTWALSISISLF